MDYYKKVLSSFEQYERLLHQAIAPHTACNDLETQIRESFRQFQTTIESVVSSEILINCNDAFERTRDALVTSIISISDCMQNMQVALSVLASRIPDFVDDSNSANFTSEVETDSHLVPVDDKKKRPTMQDIVAILTLLIGLLQMLSSAIDSRQAEIRHHQEMQIKEEELRLMKEQLCLMEEQRDYVASFCEQFLTILDDSESTPSPSPTPEPTPPMSDTAEISSPLEVDAIPDDMQLSVDASDAPNKSSESD